jgi:hypothetical protein
VIRLGVVDSVLGGGLLVDEAGWARYTDRTGGSAGGLRAPVEVDGQLEEGALLHLELQTDQELRLHGSVRVAGCGAAEELSPLPILLTVGDREVPVVGARLAQDGAAPALLLSSRPVTCGRHPRGTTLTVAPADLGDARLSLATPGQASSVYWRGHVVPSERDALTVRLTAPLRPELNLELTGVVEPLRCDGVTWPPAPALGWEPAPAPSAVPPVDLPHMLAGIWAFARPDGLPGAFLHVRRDDRRARATFATGPWRDQPAGPQPSVAGWGGLEDGRLQLRPHEGTWTLELALVDADHLVGVFDDRPVQLERWLPDGARLRPADAVARAFTVWGGPRDVDLSLGWTDDGAAAWRVVSFSGARVVLWVDAADGRVLRAGPEALR